MPYFEYECADCGAVSGFLEGVTQEKPELKCRACGGTELARLLSPSNFQMKVRTAQGAGQGTCCGREERCDNPPCGDGGECER